LDRHPKADPGKEYPVWREQAIDSIVAGCEAQGLPRPVEVDVNKTPWHFGAPRSKPGPDGMPLLPVKSGMPARQQIHVRLRFPEEVAGPLLLGAGRYRGYGLFKSLAATNS
jgi:CRISPR-associated protein Csb2